MTCAAMKSLDTKGSGQKPALRSLVSGDGSAWVGSLLPPGRKGKDGLVRRSRSLGLKFAPKPRWMHLSFAAEASDAQTELCLDGLGIRKIVEAPFGVEA